MQDAEDIWVRDDRGRVGKLVGVDRVRYASGEQKRPAQFAEIPDHYAAQYEFSRQRDDMWLVVYKLDSLNRSVLARMAKRRETIARGSLKYEELLADVGVATIRRAALLYDAAKCGSSMRGYVSKCLKRAYARALDVGDRDPNAARGSCERGAQNERVQLGPILGGLEHREQLSTIIEAAGLSLEEIDLLMSRYDSEVTLRDLAEQLDVSSPQTVLNCLNRILERCRRAAS